jgi:proteic killer suppression protein
MSIQGFRHKGLRELFENGRSAKIGKRYEANALVIMDFLEAIAELKDCIGVQDFHELKGKNKGTYSMHVNGNYCITFKWNGQHVYDLDFVDYH